MGEMLIDLVDGVVVGGGLSAVPDTEVGCGKRRRYYSR